MFEMCTRDSFKVQHFIVAKYDLIYLDETA